MVLSRFNRRVMANAAAAPNTEAIMIGRDGRERPFSISGLLAN